MTSVRGSGVSIMTALGDGGTQRAEGNILVDRAGVQQQTRRSHTLQRMRTRKRKTPQHEAEAFYEFNPGDDLLSHAVTRAVPWALEGLTTVFGMGTGVTPPV